jgi:hypothetical protein
MTAQHPIPKGFRAVSCEEFFAVVGKENVTPSVAHPDFTSWETPDRRVIGWSLPGWKHPGDAKVWALKEAN